MVNVRAVLPTPRGHAVRTDVTPQRVINAFRHFGYAPPKMFIRDDEERMRRVSDPKALDEGQTVYFVFPLAGGC